MINSYTFLKLVFGLVGIGFALFNWLGGDFGVGVLGAGICGALIFTLSQASAADEFNIDSVKDAPDEQT